ncbi:MAG: enoyl-CoA hydratase/isomerase family protein [Deltaproteobacteria bacterium]|nr:enoyl-CoA hydratase/isomerase family protein [Deltaproteobacteria bacterium]
MSVTTDAVLYEPASAERPIGIVRMNRPQQRNSMTAELLDAFGARVLEARADPHLRCLVVTGSGACFSAGADLRAQIQRAATGEGPARMPHEASFAMYTPFLSILDVEVPVIGALNGHTVGGGFGLALLCDVRIGNLDARYGANFARLGLHSGLGISYVLPRLIGASRAAELLFTGRLVSGHDAAQMGILSRAVPAEQVMTAALSVAHEIAQAAPIAVRMMKATMRDSLGWNVRQAAWAEAYAQSATIATHDFKEGMEALLGKREPRFEGR